MNYLEEMEQARQVIDDKAMLIIKDRPEKSIGDLDAENYELASEILRKAGDDFDKVSEPVAQLIDGGYRFGDALFKKGSLAYSLGLSLAALEAHAWLLNDYLTGKAEDFNPGFPLVAKVAE
jgi:hypothetical protein